MAAWPGQVVPSADGKRWCNLKVGNRDAEAAVADRYRKGPISSAYAIPTEMAAMKAQNAGLKAEVSDLKYENEQMKAQTLVYKVK